MQPIDPARLAQELAAARPQLDATQQPLALTLYRLLAQGRPVSPEQIAEQAGVDAGRVAGLLERRYGVELDANRSVVGFWGLTLSPTPHRLDIDGQRLYAWCAWDTLFLPGVLRTPIAVESTCPTTGDAVSLTVTRGGVVGVEPTDALLSMRHPDAGFCADTRASFCCHVHFFASEHAFTQWTRRDEETFAVSVDDGFAIASRVNEATYAPARLSS
jgi:alkylmercury lyase